MDSDDIIPSLPLSEMDRAEFVEHANDIFEQVITQIKPDNEDMTRALWDAGHYIDYHLPTRTRSTSSRRFGLRAGLPARVSLPALNGSTSTKQPMMQPLPGGCLPPCKSVSTRKTFPNGKSSRPSPIEP